MIAIEGVDLEGATDEERKHFLELATLRKQFEEEKRLWSEGSLDEEKKQLLLELASTQKLYDEERKKWVEEREALKITAQGEGNKQSSELKTLRIV